MIIQSHQSWLYDARLSSSEIINKVRTCASLPLGRDEVKSKLPADISSSHISLFELFLGGCLKISPEKLPGSHCVDIANKPSDLPSKDQEADWIFPRWESLSLEWVSSFCGSFFQSSLWPLQSAQCSDYQYREPRGRSLFIWALPTFLDLTSQGRMNLKSQSLPRDLVTNQDQKKKRTELKQKALVLQP